MMIQHKRPGTLVVVAWALCLYAIGATATPTTIRVVHWNEDRAFIDTIAAFNAAQSGIEAEFATVPQYPTRLQLEIASGIGPDVFVVHPWNTPVGLWGPGGVMLDLTPLWQRDSHELQPSDWYKPALASGTSEGRIFAVFYGLSVYAHLDYDVDALDGAGVQPPSLKWAWNDLTSAAVKLTKDLDGDGKPERWGLQRGFADWRALSSLILSTAHPIFLNNDRQFDINTLGSYRAMNWIVDLHKRNVMGGNWANGTAAMRAGSGWVHIAEPVQSGAVKFRAGTAIMPADPETGGRLFRGGSLGLAINATSLNQAAAWEFIKFFVGQRGWAKEGMTGRGYLTHIPGRRSLGQLFLKVDSHKFPPTLDPRVALDAMAYSEPLNISPNQHINANLGAIESYLTQEWAKVVKGEAAPGSFVATVTPQVNRILSEGK